MHVLSMYTVYAHPRDFPDRYVIRRFTLDRPTEEVHLFDVLDQARSWCQARGLFCLGREVADDPCIVETWI